MDSSPFVSSVTLPTTETGAVGGLLGGLVFFYRLGGGTPAPHFACVLRSAERQCGAGVPPAFHPPHRRYFWLKELYHLAGPASHTLYCDGVMKSVFIRETASHMRSQRWLCAFASLRLCVETAMSAMKSASIRVICGSSARWSTRAESAPRRSPRPAPSLRCDAPAWAER